jgi:hypothetical protein
MLAELKSNAKRKHQHALFLAEALRKKCLLRTRSPKGGRSSANAEGSGLAGHRDFGRIREGAGLPSRKGTRWRVGCCGKLNPAARALIEETPKRR